jgi:hypothetical protein
LMDPWNVSTVSALSMKEQSTERVIESRPSWEDVEAFVECSPIGLRTVGT